MTWSKPTAIVTVVTAVGLLAGCSGGSGETNQGSAVANAATKNIVNASDKEGGTLVYENSDSPDSFDPGNTYYAYIYNFSRLYARPLTTFKPGAGEAGNELVPDLAASLGKASDGGKTWTYKIRAGLKYEDGTPITSADVKYAVERSNFSRDVLSNGASYFASLLEDPDKYKGPYKDKSDKGLSSIETPDDTTIVFHLKQAFADFDYLVSSPQTAPVPKAEDTGADYQKKILSSGSYKFSSYEQDKQVTLVRNEEWDAKTDPLRKQLPDKIVVKLKVAQTTIDQNLLAGNTHVDLGGRGVDTQTQAKLLTDKAKLAKTDNTLGGRLVYTAINTTMKPFDNVHCRKAVEYAVNKVSAQTAMGGSVRGDVASTVLPPDVPGYKKDDLYATKDNEGDVAKAKAELKECGKPDGFKTVITARNDRDGEVDAATAVQASLKKIGITVEIQQYPSAKYFSDFAGVPKFNQSKGVGLIMMQWSSDWPTGYGFLQQILDGNAIGESGNTNLSELDDPEINKLLSDTIANTDQAARETAYAQIDKLTMEQAAIVPLTYFKILVYRPDSITNVASTAAFSGQYDYLNIGLE